MKTIKLLTVCVMIFFTQTSFSEEQQLTPEQEQYLNEMKQIWDSLDRKTGEVNLQNGVAKLNVPESFYYLNSADAEKILVQVWGNPPGTKILGMLLPSETTPFDDESWGVTIEYVEDGYVSDDDADEIDYDDLLSQMQEETGDFNKQRVQQGYESIELIGWASKPYYDKTSHKLHWAKELKFGKQDLNTLNYNIRVLGRKGVLVLNFIAGMDQKHLIDSQLNNVLAMAEFQQGFRYEDFDSSIDNIAAYGLGALVAGKVVAKTGILAAILIFLKKFGVLLILGIGALFGKIFRR
jgi:uncharacterized membrane-anchored protein